MAINAKNISFGFGEEKIFNAFQDVNKKVNERTMGKITTNGEPMFEKKVKNNIKPKPYIMAIRTDIF